MNLTWDSVYMTGFWWVFSFPGDKCRNGITITSRPFLSESFHFHLLPEMHTIKINFLMSPTTANNVFNGC